MVLFVLDEKDMQQQLKVMEEGGSASTEEMGRGCREPRKKKSDSDEEVRTLLRVCTAKWQYGLKL